MVNASTSREASLGIRLLTDLKTIFKDTDKMATNLILEALHAVDESPWAELKGKPLDARGLAWRLSQYSIRSKNLRQDDESILKGYTAEDLYDAWCRYLPDEDTGSGVEEGATSATSATSRAHALADDLVVAPVADVADDRTPEAGTVPDFDIELFEETA